MKTETKSFYEAAVHKAITHICALLDGALDLEALARGAALSPFHFHRVFRGMVGETPVELHRRLRLERAAAQLSAGSANVTRVAFQAGYETHESFTRAFRAAYGVAPSEFRQRSTDPAPCAPIRSGRLAARCGVHFVDDQVVGTTLSELSNIFKPTGGDPMNVEIKMMPAFRLATVHHVGPYDRISEAFAKLGATAGPAGLFQHPNVNMIGVYHDDPESTPAERLQSDAGISVPDGVALPAGVGELRLPAGRYASTIHVGPYNTLGDAWARLMGEWLPRSGHRIAAGGLSYELYRNTPETAPPEALRTELYVPLA